MKRYVTGTVAVALLLAWGSFGHAQVQLKIELEESSCLQYERIHALVTVLNDTDAPLLIGDSSKPGYLGLAFEMNKSRHERVAKRSSLPIVRDVKIDGALPL